MENLDKKTILKYLQVFELPLDEQINLDILQNKYSMLSDNKKSKKIIDGELDEDKSALINEAYDYLSKNIDLVNELILNKLEITDGVENKNEDNDLYLDLFAKWDKKTNKDDEKVKKKQSFKINKNNKKAMRKAKKDEKINTMRTACVKYVEKVILNVDKDLYDEDIYQEMEKVAKDYKDAFNEEDSLIYFEISRKKFIKEIFNLKKKTKILRNSDEKREDIIYSVITYSLYFLFFAGIVVAFIFFLIWLTTL